jgi:hypothetical protein
MLCGTARVWTYSNTPPGRVAKVRRLAGDFYQARGAEIGGRPRHIRTAALVEPEHGGTDALVRCVEKANSLALVGDGECRDASGRHLRGELGEGRRGLLPPLRRLLLEGAGIDTGTGARPSATARPSRVQATALVAVVLLSSPTTRSIGRIRSG